MSKSFGLFLDQGFSEGKEMEMKKVDDLMVPSGWIIFHFHFHFHFPHQIRDPNTALVFLNFAIHFARWLLIFCMHDSVLFLLKIKLLSLTTWN